MLLPGTGGLGGGLGGRGGQMGVSKNMERTIAEYSSQC